MESEEIRICKKCNEKTYRQHCPICGGKTILIVAVQLINDIVNKVFNKREKK